MSMGSRTALSFVLLCLLLSCVSEGRAAETPAPFPSRRASGATTLRAVAPAQPSSYSTKGDLNLTSSIGGVGQFTYGPGLQLEFPMVLEGHRFAFGGQTAFYHSGLYAAEVAGTKIKGSAWSVPILMTGKYLWSSRVPFLQPYFAVAAGVSIDRVTAKGTPVAANAMFASMGFEAPVLPEVKVSSTSTNFALLLRPGITVGDTQRWFFELPFGSVRKQFAILPTVGFHF